MVKINRKSLRQALSIVTALVLAVLLLCAASLTASAADSKAINTGIKGSVTLTVKDAGTGTTATDGEFALYSVGNLNSNKTAWVLNSAFSSSGVSLTNLDSASLAKTLSDYATNNNISPAATATVKNGVVTFSDLSVGVYLVVQTSASTNFYEVNPFLVTLPIEEGNSWSYSVDATPKAQIELITSPDGTTPGGSDEPTTSTPGGSTGTSGSGDTNNEGGTGTDGSNGTNGTNGTNGSDGSDSANGTNGSDGTNGTNGSNGTNGASGLSGTDGSDGSNGSSSNGYSYTSISPSGSSGSSSSSSSTTLPQTGQLYWPIPVLIGAGVVLIVVGLVLRRKKKAKAE